MTDFYTSVSPKEADNLIKKHIINGSITGVLLDSYESVGENGDEVIVSVYEKHYYRAGNRLTLTVVIDNVAGNTHIHTVGGGGGEGLLRFDWGASEAFESAAYDALRSYIIE